MVMAVTAGHKVWPAGDLLKHVTLAAKCISPDILRRKYNAGSFYIASRKACIFGKLQSFFFQQQMTETQKLIADLFSTFIL